MIVFRWIMAVFGALFAVTAVVSFALHIAFDSRIWLERARSMRHWLWLVALLWFNVEVWGRVILTIVRWQR